MKAQWKEKAVGEVLRLEYGRPLDGADRKTNGLYPVYGANGEKDRSDKFYFDRPSIIVGRKGSAGEVNLTEEKFWPLDVTYFVTFDERQHELRFLYYLLTTLDLQSLAKGVKPGINRNEIYSQVTRVPPLPEQQRIVGVLDEAYEGIATAKANADRNRRNARALLQSHLQSVFTQRSLGWVKTTIGEHVRFIDYRGKTPEKTKSGLRLITAKNVKMGYLQQTPREFVALASYDGWMTRGIPRRGDVLFTTEAPLANVAQLDTDEKVVFAQRIIIMQPRSSKLDSTFLKYLLLSQLVQRRIHAKGTGATAKGIKASLLKTVEISFPKSLGEQKQIVAKLDAVTEETQRLESLYQGKLAALEALKKSLLHQAFTGQL
jgi:type I restriction enzyme S subunit